MARLRDRSGSRRSLTGPLVVGLGAATLWAWMVLGPPRFVPPDPPTAMLHALHTCHHTMALRLSTPATTEWPVPATPGVVIDRLKSPLTVEGRRLPTGTWLVQSFVDVRAPGTDPIRTRFGCVVDASGTQLLTLDVPR